MTPRLLAKAMLRQRYSQVGKGAILQTARPGSAHTHPLRRLRKRAALKKHTPQKIGLALRQVCHRRHQHRNCLPFLDRC